MNALKSLTKRRILRGGLLLVLAEMLFLNARQIFLLPAHAQCTPVPIQLTAFSGDASLGHKYVARTTPHQNCPTISIRVSDQRLNGLRDATAVLKGFDVNYEEYMLPERDWVDSVDHHIRRFKLKFASSVPVYDFDKTVTWQSQVCYNDKTGNTFHGRIYYYIIGW